MFNLCKTVKIYHTVNHYHPHSAPSDPSELTFNQAPLPLADSPSSDHHIRMIQSHSMSPKKSRTGINLSIKESSASPYKYSQHTQDQDYSRSRQHAPSTNTHCRQSERSSLKIKIFKKEDKLTPKIVQSKITYEEMLPNPAIKENPSKGAPVSEKYMSNLSELPLKKHLTGTTQLSNNSNQPKIIISSPLKKSTTFIRSSSRSRIEDSVRNSVQNSLSNSIDFKFSGYKLKREDASQSLLRLSCSSYSQIFDRPNKNGCQDFSQSCSLQLKREDSLFLKEYVCEVNQSIIIDRSQEERTLKAAKSNNDLLDWDLIQDQGDKHNKSMLEVDSPVRKLKKRYGDSLLHPYDKQTIISKSFASKSHNDSKEHPIIDQSIIIEHQIQAKFIPLKGKEVNKHEFRMFLAVENIAKILVTIKQYPIRHINRINQELNIYKDIQSHKLDVNVSKLYQIYTHGDIFVLVKEPYELTLNQFIEKHSQEYVLISWEFIARSIEENLLKIIQTMQKDHLYLNRPISTQDLVYAFGQWKLHSPDMFCASHPNLNISSSLALLRQEMLGRIGRPNH